MKRIVGIAFSGLLIITLIVASFGSIKADNPPGDLYSVGGWVTLNGKPAPAGLQIILSIPKRTNCINITTAEGRYTVDFEAKQGEIANFTVYVYKQYVRPLDNQSFTITDPTPHWYYINLSVNATEQEEEEQGGGGGGGGNNAPIAVLDAKAYFGFVGESVTFNGSKSYDSDGTIVSWSWSFGDGTSAPTAKIATHVYTTSGTFKVNLTVTDDLGATSTPAKATATILYPNQPPSVPTLSGPQTGAHNTSYAYTATSVDPENSTLTYLFSWGDGTTDTSSSTASGTPVTMSHTWNHAGVYTLSVTVFDVENASAQASMTVLMSVIWVDGLGYLLDYNGDGIYDAFYSNATGQTTIVQRLADGTYLIDSDGDGVWDHQFNPLTKELMLYTPPPVGGGGVNGMWVLAGILGAILVLFLILLLLTRRSKKKEGSETTTAPEPKPKGKSRTKK